MRTHLYLLHDIAMSGLFRNLGSNHRGTRRATISAFGEIAKAIQPFTILNKLLDNLKADERSTRICTEVAIAAIANHCSPIQVVPFLVNEYLLAETLTTDKGLAWTQSIQRGVLKSLRFVFEFVGPNGKECTYAVLPLLERALTEGDLQTRRMGCELARNLILAYAGHGYEDATIHILNFVYPNIVEALHGNTLTLTGEQEKLLRAVVEVFEAARLAVSAGVILGYLTQGLWHPSAKVREIYWRTYNSLYLGCADQLVPFYPETYKWATVTATVSDVPNPKTEEGEAAAAMKHFRRHELDYMI